jgi:hypothetical protein
LDLSFLRIEKDLAAEGLPSDLAVLLVGMVARQAASPTAVVASQLGAEEPAPEPLLGTQHGPFSPTMAQALSKWKQT